MKNIMHHFKSLILIGAIPLIMFWIAYFLASWLYPKDVDGAGTLIIVFAGAGSLVAIFLLVQNSRRLIKHIMNMRKK
jgi:hypothetical protein